MNKQVLNFLVALFVIISVITILTYIGPSRIIDIIGIKNVYISVFILGIIGGVSALSAAGFYATLFSLSVGGANPFILAAFSAPGVLLGDFLFWYLGLRGKEVIDIKYGKYLSKLSTWLNKKPKWFMPIMIYVYTGFTPFPGDFLMFLLAFMNYHFKQIFIPTLLGNYTLALMVSLFGLYGIKILN